MTAEVDLHLHSRASDGTDSPGDVIEQAAALGLKAVALVDHDTLAGTEEARQAASRLRIRLIPGTELSVDWPLGRMHMLVYFLEPGPGPLQDRLAWLRDGRNRRNLLIVAKLRDLGYDITLEQVVAQARGDSVGRPHIADALVDAGYVESRSEAFVELLRDGGSAYVERDRFEAREAIELARDSGAVPVIAHPYTIGLNREDYAATFEGLTRAGLGGIEAHHADHPPELRVHLASIASDLGIVATGGSDYHGTGRPGVEIGIGRGDLAIAAAVVDALDGARTG